MKIKLLLGMLSSIAFIGSCAMPSSNQKLILESSAKIENPFFSESSLYMKYPHFDKVKNEHYAPAFEKGMENHMKEIEAIAKNIQEMATLKVPVICIVIGEGASGGALGIGVGDKVHMLENTWYSVISPESCSSILWRSWDYKQQAAEALKLTSEDMFKNKLIDNIIKEPEGGAHYNPEEIYDRVRETINKDIKSLSKLDPQKRIEKRIEKFCSMGVINE